MNEKISNFEEWLMNDCIDSVPDDSFLIDALNKAILGPEKDYADVLIEIASIPNLAKNEEAINDFKALVQFGFNVTTERDREDFQEALNEFRKSYGECLYSSLSGFDRFEFNGPVDLKVKDILGRVRKSLKFMESVSLDKYKSIEISREKIYEKDDEMVINNEISETEAVDPDLLKRIKRALFSFPSYYSGKIVPILFDLFDVKGPKNVVRLLSDLKENTRDGLFISDQLYRDEKGRALSHGDFFALVKNVNTIFKPLLGADILYVKKGWISVSNKKVAEWHQSLFELGEESLIESTDSTVSEFDPAGVHIELRNGFNSVDVAYELKKHINVSNVNYRILLDKVLKGDGRLLLKDIYAQRMEFPAFEDRDVTKGLLTNYWLPELNRIWHKTFGFDILIYKEELFFLNGKDIHQYRSHCPEVTTPLEEESLFEKYVVASIGEDVLDKKEDLESEDLKQASPPILNIEKSTKEEQSFESFFDVFPIQKGSEQCSFLFELFSCWEKGTNYSYKDEEDLSVFVRKFERYVKSVVRIANSQFGIEKFITRDRAKKEVLIYIPPEESHPLRVMMKIFLKTDFSVKKEEGVLPVETEKLESIKAPKENSVLDILNLTPNVVVSEDDLVSKTGFKLATLRVYISKLNKQNGKKLIFNKRGEGYYVGDLPEEDIIPKIVKKKPNWPRTKTSERVSGAEIIQQEQVTAVLVTALEEKGDITVEHMISAVLNQLELGSYEHYVQKCFRKCLESVGVIHDINTCVRSRSTNPYQVYNLILAERDGGVPSPFVRMLNEVLSTNDQLLKVVTPSIYKIGIDSI